MTRNLFILVNIALLLILTSTSFAKKKDAKYKQQKIAIQRVLNNPKDKKNVYDAVYMASKAFKFADDSLKSDKDFVISIMQQDGRLLPYVANHLKKDSDVVNAVIQELSLTVYRNLRLSPGYDSNNYDDAYFEKEKDFILSVIDSYVSTETDETDKASLIRDIVLTAVKKNGNALMFFDEFISDEEIVVSAVTQKGAAIQFADDKFLGNKTVMLAAVTNNGPLLEEADENIKNDKEIVLAALKSTGYAFSFASDALKKNKEFILKAVQLNSEALSYAEEALKDNKEIALAAVRQSGYALQNISPRLKKDKEIVTIAIKQDPTLSKYIIKHADKSLQENTTFLRSLGL